MTAPLRNLQEAIEERERRLKSSLYLARDVKPDQYARVLSLSGATGVPPRLVEGAEKEIESKQPFPIDVEGLRADFPVLAGHLESPDFAKLAKDDLGPLGWLEQRLRANRQYGREAWRQFTGGRFETEYSDLSTRDFYAHLGLNKPLSREEWDRMVWTEELGAATQQIPYRYRQSFWTHAPLDLAHQLPNMWELTKEGAGWGFGTGLAMWVLSRGRLRFGRWAGVGASAGVFHASFKLQAGPLWRQLHDVRDENGNPLNPDDAAAITAVGTAMMALLDSYSFGRFVDIAASPVKRAVVDRLKAAAVLPAFRQAARGWALSKGILKPAGGALWRYGKAVTAETITEPIQELIEEAGVVVGETSLRTEEGELRGLDGAVLELMKPENFIALLERAAPQMKVAAGVAGRATAIAGIPGVGISVVAEISQAQKAKSDQASLQETGARIRESKLFQRHKGAFESFAVSALEGDEDPNVYIDLQPFLASMEEEKIDPRAALQALRVEDQVDEALEVGGDLRVPLSRVLALSDEPWYEAMLIDLRTSLEAMTPRRAEEKLAELQASLMPEEAEIAPSETAAEAIAPVEEAVTEPERFAADFDALQAQTEAAEVQAVEGAATRAQRLARAPSREVLDVGAEQIEREVRANLELAAQRIKKPGEKLGGVWAAAPYNARLIAEHFRAMGALLGEDPYRLYRQAGLTIGGPLVPKATEAQIVEVLDRLRRPLEVEAAIEGVAPEEMRRFRQTLSALRRGEAPKGGRFKAYPVLDMIRRLGGVNPDSAIAAELRGLGVTGARARGVFRSERPKGRPEAPAPLRSLDAIPRDEEPLFQTQGRTEAYISEQEILDAVAAELAGRPLRTEEEIERIQGAQGYSETVQQTLDELGLDLRELTNEEVIRRIAEVETEGMSIWERLAGLVEAGEVWPDLETQVERALKELGLDPTQMSNDEILARLRQSEALKGALTLFQPNLEHIRELSERHQELIEKRVGKPPQEWDRITREELRPISEELERLTGHPRGLNDPETRARLEKGPTAINKKLVNQAIAEFGLTDDIREAGYILPDGRMLDFSGKRQGGPSGTREMDHRSGLGALNIDRTGLGPEPYTELMLAFMDQAHAIRLDMHQGFVEIAHPLTRQQSELISRAIAESANVFTVEMIRMPSGLTVSVQTFSPHEIVSVSKLLGWSKRQRPTFFQPDALGGIRGLIAFSPERTQASIRLFKTADESTFLHETGHLFLESLRRFAAVEGAPQQVVDDWAALREEMGLAEEQAPAREHHEWFAEQFEAYVATGRAPSLRLKQAFERFRQWLRALWDAARRQRIEVNPVVAEILDRLLTTPRDLAEMKIREDVETEVRQSPAYRAIQDLEAGVPAEVAAEAWGFMDAAELERYAATNPDFEAQIERQTADRIRREFPEPLLPPGPETEPDLAQAVYTDARADALADEFTLLQAQAGIPRQPGINASMRARAHAMMRGKRIREIKPLQYQAQEQRAAREALDAARRGQFDIAARAKERQILQHHLFVAAKKAESEIDRHHKHLGRYNRAGIRQAISEGKGQYMGQIDALRARFGLTARQPDPRTIAFPAWVKEQKEHHVEIMAEWAEVATADPERPSRNLLSETDWAIPWEEMTLEQLEGFRDTLTQIETLARNANRIWTDELNRSFDENVDRMVESIYANNKRKEEPVEYSKTARQQFKHGLSGVHAAHTKMEFLWDWLDGYQARGPVWETLGVPVQRAFDEEVRLFKEKSAALDKIWSRYSGQERAEFFSNKRIFVPEVGRAFKKVELFAIWLNWGNLGNREALMRGERWTEQQVLACLSHLSKKDLDTGQMIWDFLETFRDPIGQLEYSLTGVRLKWVDADPVETEHGTYRGGYYPLAYDPEKKWLTFARAERERALGQDVTNYMRPATRSGHRKARIGSAGQAVQLDISVLTNHVRNVIHDLTHTKMLLDLDRMTLDSRFREAVETTHGRQPYKLIRPYLRHLARDLSEPYDFLDHALSHARAGATIVNMGLKWTTMIQQPLGIFQAWDYMNVEPGLKGTASGAYYLVKGIREFYSRPDKIADAIRFVWERSPQMESRPRNWDREIRDYAKRGKGKGLVADRQSAFLLGAAAFEFSISIPTWLGAYQQGMNSLFRGDPNAERKSIEWADKVVRNSQGSGATKDLAQIARGGPKMRIFNMFYTFFSAQYNLAARRLTMTRRQGLHGIPAFAVFAGGSWLVSALAAAWVSDQGPEDDEEWAVWAGKELGAYLFSPIIGVRDLARGIFYPEYGYEITPIKDVGEALVRSAEAAEKLVTEGEISRSALKQVNLAIGYLLKLPAKQTWFVGEELWDYMTGDDADFSLRDALYGERHK